MLFGCLQRLDLTANNTRKLATNIELIHVELVDRPIIPSPMR